MSDEFSPEKNNTESKITSSRDRNSSEEGIIDLEVKDVSESSIMEAINGEEAVVLPKDKIVGLFHHTRSGPIPSPEELKAYNDIVPGAAQQIFNDLHIQTLHRIQMEKNDSEASIYIAKKESSQRFWGLLFAFIFSLGIIAVGAFCVYSGNPGSGSTIVVGTLVAGIGCFVYGSRNMQHSASDSSEPDKKCD